jgi:hypothetical protein
VALIALFVALGGPAKAAKLIEGSTIRKGTIAGDRLRSNTITGKQVRNRSLSTSDLSSASIRSLRTPAVGSITGAQIAPKAIDGTRLAAGAVTAAAISAGSVGTAQIADGAIGAMQLGPASVSASKIADGSIGSAAVADGSLRTVDIGAFAGSVQVDFDPFNPGDCQVAELTPTPAGNGQPNASDDIIVVSPSAGWSDQLVVVGKPGASNKIRVVACYIATGNSVVLDPPPTTFRYVTFDAP